MLVDPLLSITEITPLERAVNLGMPVLDHVIAALTERWSHHLRDEETLLRLLFALDVARSEPPWSSGVPDDLEQFSADQLLAQFGGVDALSPESCLALGLLAVRRPDLVGSNTNSEQLLDRAGERMPESLIARFRGFFAGDLTDALEVRRRRTHLLREIHARFAGRGLPGLELKQHMSRAVNRAGTQIRL
jgi:hypothetical protein